MSAVYDHNDAELVEGMKYLVLPPEEKIKLQAQPFDGKKACWVPDPKESYVAGEITGTKGDDVIVKTAKGEVRRSIPSIDCSIDAFSLLLGL
jgi:myosin heavy chain 6/7